MTRKGTFVGTPDYMPPELCKSTMSCFSSDLWSLGVIVYQMLTTRSPFRAATDYLTMQKVQTGVKALVYPHEFPQVAKDLIEALLQIDPNDRLGAKSYVDLKKHPFFDGITWDNVSTSIPPPLASFGKMTWEEDVLREEQERLEAKKKETREKWEKFLKAGENILEIGYVIKTRKLSHKKRCLILTDAPRLFYVDNKNMVYKGECELDKVNLKVIVDNSICFRAVLPNRTYFFEDLEKNPQRWQDAIEEVLKKL